MSLSKNFISAIYVITSSWLLLSVQAANPVFFCKCYCGANSTVFPLPIEDPKPCALCTKQMCIDSVTDGTCDGIIDSTCPSVDFKSLCFACGYKCDVPFQFIDVEYEWALDEVQME
ncbi:hypothetical protein NQZ79_g7858 [Umbelopsis isabellina]|nr:hypothetical protein NQZ79_g7858 [Umbelopsis isabellina]